MATTPKFTNTRRNIFPGRWNYPYGGLSRESRYFPYRAQTSPAAQTPNHTMYLSPFLFALQREKEEKKTKVSPQRPSPTPGRF